MDIPYLEQKLNNELSLNNLKVVNKLKFQNLLYQPGDNIQLRSDINSPHALYAKILSIIQAKNITTFPLVYVVWYEKANSEGIQCENQSASGKELILTENKDWQYIEAVKGKIEVISENEFMHLDPKEQENSTLFYCRSYLKQNRIITDSKPHCYCQKYNSIERPLISCQLCHGLIHVECGGNKEGRCGRCSY